MDGGRSAGAAYPELDGVQQAETKLEEDQAGARSQKGGAQRERPPPQPRVGSPPSPLSCVAASAVISLLLGLQAVEELGEGVEELGALPGTAEPAVDAAADGDTRLANSASSEGGRVARAAGMFSVPFQCPSNRSGRSHWTRIAWSTYLALTPVNAAAHEDPATAGPSSVELAGHPIGGRVSPRAGQSDRP